MNTIVDINVSLIQKHQALIGRLTKEAKSLRNELLLFAQAYAKLPAALQTQDTFELFMRDIHLAHEELRQRLLNILNNKMGEALSDARKQHSNLIDQINQEKELQELLIEQHQEETALQKKSEAALKKELDELKRQNKDLQKELYDLKSAEIPRLKSTILELHRNKQNLENFISRQKRDYVVPLQHMTLWEFTNVPITQLIKKLTELQKKDLDKVKASGELLSSQANQQINEIYTKTYLALQTLDSTMDNINEAMKEIDNSWFTGDAKKELQKAKGNLEECRQHLADSIPSSIIKLREAIKTQTDSVVEHQKNARHKTDEFSKMSSNDSPLNRLLKNLSDF